MPKEFATKPEEPSPGSSEILRLEGPGDFERPFERDRPRGALDAGRWRSLNGDIGAMEFYSAHWDAAGERWIGGAQDNDVQVAPERCGASDVALWRVELRRRDATIRFRCSRGTGALEAFAHRRVL